MGVVCLQTLYSLSILFRPQLSGSVCDTDSKLFGPLDDFLANSGGNRVGNGGGIIAVVHHEHLEVAQALDLGVVS